MDLLVNLLLVKLLFLSTITMTSREIYEQGFDEDDFKKALRGKNINWELTTDTGIGGKGVDNELYPKILFSTIFSGDESVSTYKRDVVDRKEPLRPIIPLTKYEFLKELAESDRPELSVPAKLNLKHKAYSRWKQPIRVRRKGILGRLGFTRLEQPEGEIPETTGPSEPDVIELFDAPPVQVGRDVGALGM